MTLPTSTIVMALVTCVPFGLAIRDTVSGKTSHGRSAHGDYEDADSDRARRHMELEQDASEDRLNHQAEAEAREERRSEEERERIGTALEDVFGPRPTQLGKLFGTVSLGTSDTDLPADAQSAISRFGRTNQLRISLDTHGGTLFAIRVSPRHYNEATICEELETRLVKRWGQATLGEGSVWLDPMTHGRATLVTGDACKLTFDQYAPPSEWLTKTPTSIIPLWAIGQTSAKLVDSLTTRADLSMADSEISWNAPGLGDGTGATRLVAHIENRKVVGISALVGSTEATTEVLLAQLTAAYGEPRGEDVLNWRSRPAITLAVDENELALTIGTARN